MPSKWTFGCACVIRTVRCAPPVGPKTRRYVSTPGFWSFGASAARVSNDTPQTGASWPCRRSASVTVGFEPEPTTARRPSRTSTTSPPWTHVIARPSSE
jgi:hypothetical protein